MKQIILIHGGDSFLSYEEYLNNLKNKELDIDRIRPSKRWTDQVIETFQNEEVLTPTMPNSSNAQFEEWKIWFEKIIPFFRDDVRLIGHSLGAMFLAKYLNDNPLKKPVKQLILLAGGYGDDSTEGYGSFTVHSAKNLTKSAREIHLMHSKDDFVVPFSELSYFQTDLPEAIVHIFEDKNHFLDPEFPELIDILKR